MLITKPHINSKLPNVGTTIFTVMSQLATENKAINLSQGFPDFPCDPILTHLVSKAMKDGLNQYSPMPGLPLLRERIAEKTKSLYGKSYDPNTEITVTAGATQAIYTAIAAIINKGDEVIIFEPAYDCYEPAIDIHGGITKRVQLNAADYSVPWEKVKSLISDRTRMIIINTPHNPTGAVMTESDMKQLAELVRDTNILLISDEVYEHIIFDGIQHQSVSRFPELAERTFIISSFGKTFHTTGWKMGYCVAPAPLMKEFRKVHQFLVFACNTPMQHAIANYLENEKNYIDLGKFYQQKRDLFLSLVKTSRFKMKPAAGTYFQLLSYDTISNEKEADIAIRLTKEFKIASIPISVFYHQPTENKMLRFCFAKKEETLKAAAEILCKI